MISNDELKELFSENTINLYQAIASEDTYKNKCLQLAENSIEKLIEFINENKLSVAFYEYFRYSKDEYFMDAEEFEDISSEVMDVFISDIEEHNKVIESIDFSKPYILKVFCNYGNLIVFVSVVDDWLTEQGVIPAGMKLEELLDRYEPTLDEIFSDRDERRRKLFDELKTFIENDPEFLKCTNANFRRRYFYDLAEREETQKYIELIKDKDGYMNQEVNMLIQELWRDYRLSKKKEIE